MHWNEAYAVYCAVSCSLKAIIIVIFCTKNKCIRCSNTMMNYSGKIEKSKSGIDK